MHSPNSKSTKDGYAAALQVINGFHKSLTEEGLEDFDKCKAHQVCNWMYIEAFVMYVCEDLKMKKKSASGDPLSYSVDTAKSFLSKLKNLLENKFMKGVSADNLPAIFHAASKHDYDRRYADLNRYLQRELSTSTWGTGENEKTVVSSLGRKPTIYCCRRLFENMMDPAPFNAASLSRDRLLLSLTYNGCGRPGEALMSSTSGWEVDTVTGWVYAIWKETKLSEEKNMSFGPDFDSFYLDVSHCFGTYWAFGVERGAEGCSLVFPQSKEVGGSRAVNDIIKRLSKETDAYLNALFPAHSARSIRQACCIILSQARSLNIFDMAARSGHAFSKACNTIFLYAASNMLHNKAATVPGGAALAGWADPFQMIYAASFDRLGLSDDEAIKIDDACDFLFRLPSAKELQKRGSLRPFVRQCLASILMYLPEMELSHPGHELGRKLYSAMYDANISDPYIMDYCKRIKADFRLMNAAASSAVEGVAVVSETLVDLQKNFKELGVEQRGIRIELGEMKQLVLNLGTSVTDQMKVLTASLNRAVSLHPPGSSAVSPSSGPRARQRTDRTTSGTDLCMGLSSGASSLSSSRGSSSAFSAAAAEGASSSLPHEDVSFRRSHDGGVSRGNERPDGCSLADEYLCFKREIDLNLETKIFTKFKSSLKKGPKQKLKTCMTAMNEVADESDFLSSGELKTLRDPCDLNNFGSWKFKFMPVARKIEKRLYEVLTLRYDALRSQMLRESIKIDMKGCTRVGTGVSVSSVSNRISALKSVKTSIENHLNGTPNPGKRQKK